VLALADQVLDVLDAFHSRGIIHRDIKPANLFVTKDGIIKVLDFGLARVRDARMRATPTASGTIIGTASYMSPEQAQGKNDVVDYRTDIFAVGAVMYHALTGEIVHKGKSSMERLMSAMQTPPSSVRHGAPHVPPYIVEIVDRALAFDKEARWISAAAMRLAVRDAFARLKASRQQSVAPQAPQQPSKPPVSAADEPSVYDDAFEPSVVVEVSFGGTPKKP
jgi:serine/threonine-protein kinase